LPLLQHTRTALRQEDVLAALYQGIALDNELVLLVGGQTVLDPVPLPQRHDDVPGHGSLSGYRRQASGQGARGFALHAEHHGLPAGFDFSWSADQRDFHGACLSWWCGRERLHEGAGLLPGQRRGEPWLSLGLALALVGCRRWEQAPALLRGRPFP